MVGVLFQVAFDPRPGVVVGVVVGGGVVEGFVVDDGNAHLLENSSDLIPHPYDIIVGVCGAGHPVSA